jgi:hypothetical protein
LVEAKLFSGILWAPERRQGCTRRTARRMVDLTALRERITATVAAVAAGARNLRLETVKERLIALRSSDVGRSNVPLIAGFVIVIGGILLLSIRGAVTEKGERDFDVPAICAACGHVYGLARDEMFAQVEAAQKKGLAGANAGMQAPWGVCPKCGKYAAYRAVSCPKCGKLAVPPGFAKVDGMPAARKCWACGWTPQP